MYRVAVKRDFIARHYLIGGEWGPEGQEHSHPYSLELEISGTNLDEHGFLVDIVAIEENLERVLKLYRDQVLNEKPAFVGLNPSIEQFSRILWGELSAGMRLKTGCRMAVRLWESENAWCAYDEENDCA